MFNKIKANIFFNVLLKRPNIDNAYKMVDPSDSWYDTISKVHNSLNEIKKLPHKQLEIISHDKLKLKGVYYPSKGEVTVLCIHGYTSHAEREWAFPGLFYNSLGYDVLIPYLRAHGPSEGKYISFGAFEHLDILNWIKKIKELNPKTKIIIHGLSMGAGIALDLVDKEIKDLKCLIIDAPSISIDSFFKNVSKEVFKKDSDKIYELAVKKFNKEFNVNIKDFNRLETVKKSHYPLLLSCGSNEKLNDIFNEIKENNPCFTESIILPECNHGNGMYKQTEMYQNSIKDFINKFL